MQSETRENEWKQGAWARRSRRSSGRTHLVAEACRRGGTHCKREQSFAALQTLRAGGRSGGRGRVWSAPGLPALLNGRSSFFEPKRRVSARPAGGEKFRRVAREDDAVVVIILVGAHADMAERRDIPQAVGVVRRSRGEEQTIRGERDVMDAVGMAAQRDQFVGLALPPEVTPLPAAPIRFARPGPVAEVSAIPAPRLTAEEGARLKVGDAYAHGCIRRQETEMHSGAFLANERLHVAADSGLLISFKSWP